MRKEQLDSITTLSDDELLRRLSELLSQSRRVESELVAHIGEVDARRLYANKGSPSMFSHCVEVLQLSEAEAYLRITVARASRKHPMLLDMLADGRLHLTGIAKIAQHLTEENRDSILARAAGKTKRQIDELVAELSPKPDVAATMRKIPRRRKKKDSKPEPELCPDRVAAATSAPRKGEPPPEPEKPPRVEPTAPARYKVTFTANAELHDKLERLRALMRSSVPDGDLATIIEEAVTETLERLESKRYGKTNAPRKSLQETDTAPGSRYIPAAVRRAVYERDGGQCTFVSDDGRRCSERNNLEFHHSNHTYGRGGHHVPSNLTLMCRTHNTLMAERDYGKEVMERYKKNEWSSHRVSEPSVVYTFGNRSTQCGFFL